MKRLKLEDFKAKNLKEEQTVSTEQLLGQVLGDCHDEIKDFDGVGVTTGGYISDGSYVRLKQVSL